MYLQRKTVDFCPVKTRAVYSCWRCEGLKKEGKAELDASTFLAQQLTFTAQCLVRRSCHSQYVDENNKAEVAD